MNYVAKWMHEQSESFILSTLKITNEVSDWIKDTTMTIAKSNRYKDYMKEIEHIEYEYLDRKVRLDPLQKRFYQHRVQLLTNHINEYLDTEENK